MPTGSKRSMSREDNGNISCISLSIWGFSSGAQPVMSMVSKLFQAFNFVTVDLALRYIHDGNLYLAQHITSLNIESDRLADLEALQNPNKIVHVCHGFFLYPNNYFSQNSSAVIDSL